MHPLEQKIKDANKNGRPALIPFLTAGFPTREKFWNNLRELSDAGADIIEIGVPFSDPVADGPVVEDASRRVLEKGVNLKEIIQGLKERKGQIKSGLVLMGYLNPFLQYGLEKLATDAKDAGISGFIVPDLPYEEAETMRNLLKAQNIALIPLVGLNTPPERMAMYAKDAEGYVYVVSVMGITGERKNIAQGVGELIKRTRQTFSVPVALGFGLKNPAQLKELPEDARPDAAVFGSALLTHLDAGKSAREFMSVWL